MEDKYLSIEPLNVGWLLHKGGGSAKFSYAARTILQLIETILEVYGYRVISMEVEPIPKNLPTRLPEFPDDDDLPLNNGTAVGS